MNITIEMQDEAKLEQEERKIFRRVFDNDDGKNILTWILNECRYFSQDAKDIDPLLMGFVNRLLGKIGIIHPHNLFEDTAIRVHNANDRDLERIINNQEEGGTL
jgi:succinate dehydrogenase flavin-adding protein (antitoxin of CptAB toxin-antitoxin module)